MRRRQTRRLIIVLCCCACGVAAGILLLLRNPAVHIPPELRRHDIAAKAVYEALNDLRKSPAGYEVRLGEPRVLRSSAFTAFPECIFLVVVVLVDGSGPAEAVLEPLLDPTAKDVATREHQFLAVHLRTGKVWTFSRHQVSQLGEFLTAQGYRIKRSEDERQFWELLEALRFCGRQHGFHRWLEEDLCEFPLSSSPSRKTALQVHIADDGSVLRLTRTDK